MTVARAKVSGEPFVFEDPEINLEPVQGFLGMEFEGAKGGTVTLTCDGNATSKKTRAPKPARKPMSAQEPVH